MSFIQRFWIIEITLLLIAAGGLWLAAYNTFSAEADNGTAVALAPSPIAAVVLPEPVPAFDANVAPSEDDFSEGEDFDDEPDNPLDEDMSDKDEGDDDEAGDSEFAESEEVDFDFVAAAADFLGVDFEQLEQELWSGKSLAEVAAEYGADQQQLTSLLVEREIAYIDSQLSTGQITAEEAAEWQDEVTIWTPFLINTGYREPEIVAAQTLGLEVEQLWERVDNGQTIQAVAETLSIDPQTVIDAIVASEMEMAQQMVVAELIDADDLTEIQSEIAQDAINIVNGLDMHEEDDDV